MEYVLAHSFPPYGDADSFMVGGLDVIGHENEFYQLCRQTRHESQEHNRRHRSSHRTCVYTYTEAIGIGRGARSKKSKSSKLGRVNRALETAIHE